MGDSAFDSNLEYGQSASAHPEMEREPHNLLEAGPLPVGSRLLFASNPVFTGRSDALLELADHLLETRLEWQAGDPQMVVISGPGGVGKTSLASEFCARYGRFFNGVHWMNAGPYAVLAEEIAQCGVKMGLLDWPDNVAAQAEAVLWAWRGTHRLVVLDGLDDPHRLAEWTHALDGAWIIVTSRIDDPKTIPPGVQFQRLPPFARSSSLAMLRMVAPRLIHAPDKDLNKLAEMLHDLPLGLSLAGQNLGERGWTTLKSFLTEIETTMENLAGPVQTWEAGQQRSLSAVFEINQKQLYKEKDQTARLALLTIACCAPDIPVPPQLIARALRLENQQIRLLENALQRMYDLGMLEETSQGPVVNSLVTEMVNLARPNPAETIEPLVATLVDLMKRANQRSQPGLFLPFRAHLQAAAAFAENISHQSSGELWRAFGEHLHQAKEYPGSRKALEHALVADEALFGRNHPSVAEDCANLGITLREQGDLLGAQACFERVVAIHKLDKQSNKAGLAAALTYLGKVRHTLNNLSGARECFESALAILEEIYGPQHAELVVNLHLLGRVLLDQEEIVPAQACFERALEINVQTHGSGHPSMAGDHFHLGRIHYAKGNLQQARTAYEHALAIEEHKYGVDSVETLPTATALARVYLDMDDAQHASPLYVRILNLYERTTGQASPEVASILVSFARAKRLLGDSAGAKASLERALAIDTRIFGANSPTVARDLNHLGRAQRALGDLTAAKECFLKVAQIDKSQWGEKHSGLASDYNNLGLVCEELGQYKEARAYFEQALNIDESLFGKYHADVGRDVNNLGSVLQALGDLNGARICYERALEISIKEAGPQHPDVAINSNNLGRVLYTLEDLQGAKACFQRALAIDSQSGSAENQEVATDAHNLGRVFLELHDYENARKSFDLALRIRKKFFPIDHPKVRSLVRSLEIVYDSIQAQGESKK